MIRVGAEIQLKARSTELLHSGRYAKKLKRCPVLSSWHFALVAE
jgi:hypothetical protein